tara:strand:+ start:444 stop:1058 length:615 start_codon:yes stop_codon:yes gene_type:complete
MVKEPIIRNIFPVPIYVSEMERKFSKKENMYFFEGKKDLLINYGNKNTKNRDVLNTRDLKDLKIILENHLKKYFTDILRVKNTSKPYITQSWINYTDKGEFHHEHVHPNSYLSGVLYINTTDKDRITFHKRGYEQIQLGVEEYNTFNSTTWRIPVKQGMIIMFPSSLKHSVDRVTEKDTRISLSFNSFVTGSIGDKANVTELKL